MFDVPVLTSWWRRYVVRWRADVLLRQRRPAALAHVEPLLHEAVRRVSQVYGAVGEQAAPVWPGVTLAVTMARMYADADPSMAKIGLGQRASPRERVDAMQFLDVLQQTATMAGMALKQIAHENGDVIPRSDWQPSSQNFQELQDRLRPAGKAPLPS